MSEVNIILNRQLICFHSPLTWSFPPQSKAPGAQAPSKRSGPLLPDPPLETPVRTEPGGLRLPNLSRFRPLPCLQPNHLLPILYLCTKLLTQARHLPPHLRRGGPLSSSHLSWNVTPSRGLLWATSQPSPSRSPYFNSLPSTHHCVTLSSFVFVCLL